MVRKEKMQICALQKNGRRYVLGIQFGPEGIFAGRGERHFKVIFGQRTNTVSDT